jgi:D-3-phosphoglycerate dehydrogenase
VAGDMLARSDWTAWRRLTPFAPLHQLTVGIIGCGRIGQAVMACLNPLVRQIIGYDALSQVVPAGVERADSLSQLLAASDVISLHIPLTVETKHLINAQTIELMKSNAILVNVSRGGLVDEGALVAALASGRLAGAALDVLEHEPPELADALLQAPNLLLSPHFAWYSSESERRARTITLDGMLAYLEGQPPVEGRLAAVPDSSRSRLRRIAANWDAH